MIMNHAVKDHSHYKSVRTYGTIPVTNWFNNTRCVTMENRTSSEMDDVANVLHNARYANICANNYSLTPQVNYQSFVNKCICTLGLCIFCMIEKIRKRISALMIGYPVALLVLTICL